MNRNVLIVPVLLSLPLPAANMGVVQLPKPETTGGKPLMQALALRHSSREFRPGVLPPRMLSNLLWAAFGVNRPDGRRTAPSANNAQPITIYAALPDGVYRYDAIAHTLVPVLPGDYRRATGTQDFVGDAALDLIYIADFGHMEGSAEDKLFYSAADAGFIAQNVYLFCASEGLATVVRGSVDRDALAATLKLRPGQKITLAQSVGYPK